MKFRTLNEVCTSAIRSRFTKSNKTWNVEKKVRVETRWSKLKSSLAFNQRIFWLKVTCFKSKLTQSFLEKEGSSLELGRIAIRKQAFKISLKSVISICMNKSYYTHQQKKKTIFYASVFCLLENKTHLSRTVFLCSLYNFVHKKKVNEIYEYRN